MSRLNMGRDKNLYYLRIEGSARNPYLIFLHEGLGCTAAWQDFPRRLCKATGCPGLIYDRVGYGRSSPLNAPFSIHFMHESALIELPLLLEAVIPGKPFILIGHSDGGSISLIYGAAKPPLLKGIITEAAHVFVDPVTLDGIRKVDMAYAQGKLKGLEKYHGPKTDLLFKTWSHTWQSPWFRHWSIEYLLPSVDQPLLVIQGRQDQYGSLDHVDTIAAKSAGPAQPLVIDGCAHGPHRQHAEAVLAAMADFIAGVAA